MKKYSLILLVCLIALMGCNTSNPEPEQAPGEVTYIFYAQTDESLETPIRANLAELVKASTDQLHQTYVAFNFDEKIVAKGNPAYIEQACSNGKTETIQTIAAFANMPKMWTPEKLAEIIKKAKAKLPAKKYVLIFSGHGDGYTFWGDDKVAVKSTPSGGDKMPGLTLADIKEGIRLSGLTKDELLMLVIDACWCGSIEYAGELSSSAQYLLASPTLTPGRGGNYTSLVDKLRGGKALQPQSFETVMTEYMHQLCNDPSNNGWNNDGGSNTLITLTRLSEMPGVLNALGNYMDAAMPRRDGLGTAKVQREFDSVVINKTFNYSLSTDTPNSVGRYYDINSFLKQVTTLLNNAAVTERYNSFVAQTKKAIVAYKHTPQFAQETGTTNPIRWTGKGVNVIQPGVDYTWNFYCAWTGAYVDVDDGSVSENYKKLQVSKVGKLNAYLETYYVHNSDLRYKFF